MHQAAKVVSYLSIGVTIQRSTRIPIVDCDGSVGRQPLSIYHGKGSIAEISGGSVVSLGIRSNQVTVVSRVLALTFHGYRLRS